MISYPAASAAICLAFASISVTAQTSQSQHDGWRADAVSFPAADGVELSGSLITPRAGTAIAVVVLVHGSGPAERYTALGALMALRRIAVLTYDKRGVAESGGRYEGVDNVSAANLELLASDATAAMQWVSESPSVRSLPRGFVGISQSGWVVPIALSRSPTVAFIGFWSGPTCTTSEPLHFQRFSAEYESDRPSVAADKISEAMRRVEYRSDDVDPLTRLKVVSVPGLWLFGGGIPMYRSIYRPDASRNSSMLGEGIFSTECSPRKVTTSRILPSKNPSLPWLTGSNGSQQYLRESERDGMVVSRCCDRTGKGNFRGNSILPN